MKRSGYWAAVLISAWLGTCALGAVVEVESPNGKLVVRLSDEGGTNKPSGVTYEIRVRDGGEKVVVERSSVGLQFKVAGERAVVGVGPSGVLKEAKREESRAEVTNPLGIRSKVIDHYNQVTVPMEDQGRRLDLIVRVYDLGVGLRYKVMEEGDFVVAGDLTEFAFSGNFQVWAGEPSTCAESRYVEGRVAEVGEKSVLPAVVKTPAGFVLVTESDLRDWAGMFIRGVRAERGSKRFALNAQLAERKDKNGCVVSKGERLSPWRVIVVSKDAKGLVDSDLVWAMASPSAIGPCEWVKPGMSAWDVWWTGENKWMPQSPRGLDARGSTESHKAYIDFAAEMGWKYQLVDWFWATEEGFPTVLPHVDMKAVFAHAKEKNVGLFIWAHSKSVMRYGIEPTMKLMEEWGAVGVKIDFMDRDDQEMVRWYEDVLACAARHHLMIDFHGAYKPTGLARTYPNFITQEGVLGNEYNKIRGQCSADHEVMLAFTRGVLGPMDFTPGGFLNRTPGEFVAGAVPAQELGTRARQLAQVVVYFSPLTVMCDTPAHYRGESGIEFFKGGVPTVWDETHVIAGEMGKVIAIARRKGEVWWIGAINGRDAVKVDLPMGFLGEGNWILETWGDSAESVWNPTEVVKENRSIVAGEKLSVRLAPAGGFAGVVRKK